MRRRAFTSARLQTTNHKSQILQRGYMMITLTLALAMITIALLTVLPDLKQQMLRDREEELRHRGTAYMRAIQHYYKKYNSYPASIEQLENTNNLRFLRKRYTDPTNRDPATGKERDFKILHPTDINLNNGPVLGTTPSVGGPLVQPALQPTGGSPTPQNVDSGDSSTGNPTSGNPSSDNPAAAAGNPNSPGSPSTFNPSSNSGSGFNGPTFGGGPIVGVASLSKGKTIHVFYGKNRYKDWLFIYVPQADQGGLGGLLKGPVNPNMPSPNLNGGNPNLVPSGGGANTTQLPTPSNPVPETPTQTPPQP
jgi:type II secretory pathway pseudopilin PulG